MMIDGCIWKTLCAVYEGLKHMRVPISHEDVCIPWRYIVYAWFNHASYHIWLEMQMIMQESSVEPTLCRAVASRNGSRGYSIFSLYLGKGMWLHLSNVFLDPAVTILDGGLRTVVARDSRSCAPWKVARLPRWWSLRQQADPRVKDGWARASLLPPCHYIPTPDELLCSVDIVEKP